MADARIAPDAACLYAERKVDAAVSWRPGVTADAPCAFITRNTKDKNLPPITH